MTLDELVGGLADGDTGTRGRAAVRGVTSDSRQVREGFVYVAIPGGHRDGAAFVPDAVSRGALAVVTEGAYRRNGMQGVPALSCPASRRAVARLCDRFHGHPSGQLTVAGITGTNGKTTTARLLRDMLEADSRRPGLIGTVAYEIGARTIPATRTTPEAPELQALLAQMVAAGCGSAVVEVSSHALAQHRCDGMAFDVGVFTNLTRDHLDYHGDMEHYFEAKARLFDAPDDGVGCAQGVINADDPWAARLVARRGDAGRTLRYGQADATADIRAVDVRVKPGGSTFGVVTPWGEAQVELPLMGRFNVSNALAALAAGGALDVPLERMVDVLNHCTPAPGRLEPVPVHRGVDVFVDYAHTDDALRNVLECLREITRRRLVVVFGCGGDRDRTKRPLMGRVVAAGADMAVLTSDNPRHEDPEAILRDVLAGMPPPGDTLRVVPDRREAIYAALDLAGEGDVVLIAGKGHETFQELASVTLPFDDRQVVRDWAAGEGAP